MTKIFDYKFLIILGLSLIVYFLYREVDLLNKRVCKIEREPGQDIMHTQLEQLELPPPPQTLPQLPHTHINVPSTVEEYSNEHVESVLTSYEPIYSHDALDTNTNECDGSAVESIINMVENVNNPQPLNEQVAKPLLLVEPMLTAPVLSVEELLKNKLDELQSIASQKGVSIYNGSGKKKKKVDLANDIYQIINAPHI